MSHRPGFLVRASVHRPVTVLMILLTFLVIGVLAYRSIPLQLVPPGFVDSTISVNIPVQESTPEEIVQTVAEPVEELFRTITGISEIESSSRSTGCSIWVTHGSNVDGDAIYADIRDRMERILPSLPEGADRYRIFRFNIETDIPIMSLAASYDDVENADALLENVVQPKIEAVDGVARVQIQGLFSRQLEIRLDPDLVQAYSVNLQRLIQRLRSDNLIEPAGKVEEGGKRYLLRISSRFRDLDEIRQYRINESLRLEDIAEVGFRRGVGWIARVDGRFCKVVEIAKEAEANTVATCTEVNRVLQEDLARDPRLAGFYFHAYFSQGDLIEASIGGMQQTSLWGGLFAIVILYLFMRRVTMTLVVAAAIPLSIMLAVVVIYFRGGTFNILSLTGLTLGIGMLIDNSIVIAENIFRRRELGDEPRLAAERGVQEVALAVTLATLTTVAVFLPIIFLGGDSNIRLMLAELGLPVCYSLIASLFVALVFIPLATTYFKGSARATQTISSGGFLGGLQRAYQVSLRWTLNHRFLACLLSLLVLQASTGLQEHMQKSGQSDGATQQVQIRVTCPPYFTLLEADETMELVRKAIDPHSDELQIETLACWFRNTGGTLMFILGSESRRTRKEFLAALRPLLPRLAGVRYRLFGDDDDSPDKETFIQATGRDPRVLFGLLTDVGDQLRRLDGVLEVVTPDRRGQDEIYVNVAREQAQRFRVNPSNVSSLVAWALRGAPLSDFEHEGEELPFWIRYQDSDLENIGDLYKVPVYSEEGVAVPLSNIADFSVGRSLPNIYRRNGKVNTWMRVVAEKDVNEIALQRRVQTLFSELSVPDGYEIVVGGGAERFEDDSSDINQALILGLILIFVLMGVLFESFLLPLSVLLCIPFMFVGSTLLVYLLGETLSGLAMVGYVILLGIVVNNAIVLIDCVNRFRLSEQDRTQAILMAGEARLRPILMTACTTVFGLAPLIVLPQRGEGFDYRPLAVVVAGGLTVSTLFTLVVVPLFYTLFDDLRLVLLRGVRWARGVPR